jgi:xylose isomerase
VHEALADADVGGLSQPSLNADETWQQLVDDDGAFEDFDVDAARTKGYGFARIQRLAIEHLLGIA